MKTDRKTELIFMAICALISLVTILDFILIKGPITENVITVSTTVESHNNASKNFHLSFKIRTQNHHFSVSENIANSVEKGDELSLIITPLFNEVNNVEMTLSGDSEIHSLRLISGLILPLLILSILAFGYKYGSQWRNVVFVFEVLAFANFVYLMN